MIEHGGSINGFRSASISFSDENIFVTILCSRFCNYPGEIAEKIAAIAR